MADEFLNEVTERIKQVVDTNFTVEETNQIGGDEVQAVANSADSTIQITSGLADELTPDEQAMVVGHEVAHLELGHSASQEALIA